MLGQLLTHWNPNCGLKTGREQVRAVGTNLHN
jgi:hypothetical protein